jgi:hypothetical protein
MSTPTNKSTKQIKKAAAANAAETAVLFKALKQNPFEAAQSIGSGIKVKQNGTPAKPLDLELPNLELYARLDQAAKAIAEFKAEVRPELEEAVVDRFVKVGAALQARPASFKAAQGAALGCFELRKRSTNSALSEDEAAKLASYNIPLEELTTVEETFVINPQYLSDSKLMQKVGTALSKVPGLPLDFILRQEPDTKVIVSDETIESVFRQPSETIAELLRMVSAIGIRTRLDNEAANFTLAALAQELEARHANQN